MGLLLRKSLLLEPTRTWTLTVYGGNSGDPCVGWSMPHPSLALLCVTEGTGRVPQDPCPRGSPGSRPEGAGCWCPCSSPSSAALGGFSLGAPAPSGETPHCSVVGCWVPGLQSPCLFSFYSSGLGAGRSFLLLLTSRSPQHPPRLASQLLQAPKAPPHSPWLVNAPSGFRFLGSTHAATKPNPTVWSYKPKQVISHHEMWLVPKWSTTRVSIGIVNDNPCTNV